MRIYELKRIDKGEGEKSEWTFVHSIQENKAVEDIKFIPSKSYGLCLAIASSEGYIKVYTANDPLKLKEWSFQYNLQINELGLSCLSWSKNLVKEEESIIAVGCKSIETSPKKVVLGMKVHNQNEQEEEMVENSNSVTVAFINFTKNAVKPLERINVPKIK